MLHVIYRSTDGDHGRFRPEWFSKMESLRSFLDSAARTEVGDVVFMNDGPPVADERAAVMAAAGEVIQLPGLGNSGSYRRAVAEALSRGWDDADVVYFVEDDYAHQGPAVPALVEAAEAIPAASFFTAYNHPDHHTSAAQRRYVRRHRGRWTTSSTSWRAVRSTTMTFAARIGALRRLAPLHWWGSAGRYPDDYGVWSATTGIWTSYAVAALTARSVALPSRYVLRSAAKTALSGRRDLLVAAAEPLATHADTRYLAPGWGGRVPPVPDGHALP